jgi:hypothetical protein
MIVSRRIVTGVDGDGASYIADVSPVSIDGRRAVLWHTHTIPSPFQLPSEVDMDVLGLLPPNGGASFQFIELPPIPPTVSLADLEAAYAHGYEGLGASHLRGDISRHPGMHKTPTLDWVMVLKGEITLLLGKDEIELRPFDVVVQRGTDHAWLNHGVEPAFLLAVMLAAKSDDVSSQTSHS